MMNFKVSIASDHAGFKLKEVIKNELENLAIEYRDLGTKSQDSVDYPDYGYLIADQVSKNITKFGIAICGSGIGISIACNRTKNIRAALCFNNEMAKLAREHNDANILVLGARFISDEEAIKIVRTFLTTEFGAGRHQKRVDKLNYQIKQS